MAAFSRVIDKIRNSEYRKAAAHNKQVFKGSKYLLLKNRANVRRKKHREQLKELLNLNEVINTVMILKDQLKLSGLTNPALGPVNRWMSGVRWPVH